MITFSDSAIVQIGKSRRSASDFFCISMTQQGCSGFAYKFEVMENPGDSFVRGEFNGVNFAISRDYVERLAGVKIDWVVDGFSSRMSVINPNVKNSCGCGSSVMFG